MGLAPGLVVALGPVVGAAVGIWVGGVVEFAEARDSLIVPVAVILTPFSVTLPLDAAFVKLSAAKFPFVVATKFTSLIFTL